MRREPFVLRCAPAQSVRFSSRAHPARSFFRCPTGRPAGSVVRSRRRLHGAGAPRVGASPGKLVARRPGPRGPAAARGGAPPPAPGLARSASRSRTRLNSSGAPREVARSRPSSPGAPTEPTGETFQVPPAGFFFYPSSPKPSSFSPWGRTGQGNHWVSSSNFLLMMSLSSFRRSLSPSSEDSSRGGGEGALPRVGVFPMPESGEMI